MFQQLKAGLPVLIKILSSASFLAGIMNVIKCREEFSSHLRYKCVKNWDNFKTVQWQKPLRDHFQEEVES